MGFIKTKEDIAILREGGMRLAGIMAHVIASVRSGIATQELDRIAEKYIREAKAKSSFKGYKEQSRIPYPASICVSVNDAIVHGVPSDMVLSDGDIVSIDIGIEYKGRFTDMARTVIVGNPDKKTMQFVRAAKDALDVGIRVVRPGAHVGDIGHAIENFIRSQNTKYGIVRELVGHGVGYAVHEDPQIPNWGTKGKGMKLEEGMVIALEPMITEGGEDIVLDRRDGWTYRTKDGSRAAHFEDTIVVTANGHEIITR